MAGEGRRALREWLEWFAWMTVVNTVFGLTSWFHMTPADNLLSAFITATLIMLWIGFYHWVKRGERRILARLIAPPDPDDRPH